MAISQIHVAANPRGLNVNDKPPANRLRVLLVDDRRDSLLVLEMLLTRSGFDVMTADDGSSALEIARQFRPAIVISDLTLPGEIDGFKLADSVRNDPTIGAARLIALTGLDSDANREQARNAGFQHYFVKPPDFDELFALLGDCAHG